MRLARYVGNGNISILEEPKPTLPEGGILVRTEASGLCSGELMAWYMDQKIPHVIGHEVCGIIEESEVDRFPVGSRVFCHHHAPCLLCDECTRGAYVHCPQWKRTKLVPGGMADYFAVGPENLTDSFVVRDLDPRNAALIEPLACVAKSISRARFRESSSVAVVGLGVMGLMHALILQREYQLNVTAFDLNDARIEWAKSLGINAMHPNDSEAFEGVIVCPGSQAAVDFALSIAAPDSKVVLFSPLGPTGDYPLRFDAAYFKDLQLLMSYSCGPTDTRTAHEWLTSERISCKEVVSDFIALEELPDAYQKMKAGQILKAMVVW